MKAKVWQPANIYPTAILGEDVNVGAFTEIGHNVEIGDRTRIGAHVFLPEGVWVGKDVFIAPHVCAINDRYPRVGGQPSRWEKIVICDGASIGANVTLMCGIKIGKGAMIGAGSVVMCDVPPCEIWFGCPAKKKGII